MKDERFKTVITPKSRFFPLGLRELFEARELIFIFVKRNFIVKYKQTILGPLWALFQPLMTASVLTFVFGLLAGFSVGSTPPFIFYFSGTLIWQLFAGCLTNSATTLTANAHILGKVYFPRLVMPVSASLSQLVSFAVQFVFFLCLLAIAKATGAQIAISAPLLLLLPLLLAHTLILGLGFGIIISALTVKYRDLAMLVGFGTQLWMYATPVIYSSSSIPDKYSFIMLVNPVAPIVELFRLTFTESGTLCLFEYCVSLCVTAVVLFVGIFLFNRAQRSFADTI